MGCASYINEPRLGGLHIATTKCPITESVELQSRKVSKVLGHPAGFVFPAGSLY